eukprot:TRINITY_DN1983_c1_g3_i1.p1 TRINITY_DN1983_c1_g3~~TRINITY_DN1983_c1_g3_i1.p1  ORF type:complete len:128 (-),score=28.93 TRINITY_DN1983_c1_g3_i1:737-1120(-)
MGNSESTTTSTSTSSAIKPTVGYHVLQVQPNGPAAGKLIPYWDFIVGTPGYSFDKEEKTLSEIFKQYLDKPITLVVYNLRSDHVREVTFTPNTTWSSGQYLVGISMQFKPFGSIFRTCLACFGRICR